MAKPEHIKILKQGVEAWNKWRIENPAIQPKFNNAKLRGVNLRAINFSHVSFGRADLSEADLRGANLSNAKLRKANLAGTVLSGAKLTYANLTHADLTNASLDEASLGNSDLSSSKLDKTNFNKASLSESRLMAARLHAVDLRNAFLYGTDFSYSWLTSTDLAGASLSHVDFSYAALVNVNLSKTSISNTLFNWGILSNVDMGNSRIQGVIFGDIDLSKVKGLETVQHGGPSIISIDCIYRSKGNIPREFLRGCGVPEDFITYARSLTNHAIEFYSCFISYSSRDQEFADRLHSDLQAKGVRVWFAPHDMKIGARIRPTIDESIRVYDKLLLVLSENSVGSPWVEQEVETALAKEESGREVLFPVRLDEAVMSVQTGWPALVKRTRHVGDFTCWKDHDSYQKAFDRLLRDLKAEA